MLASNEISVHDSLWFFQKPDSTNNLSIVYKRWVQFSMPCSPVLICSNRACGFKILAPWCSNTVQHLLYPVMQDNYKSGFILSVIGYNINSSCRVLKGKDQVKRQYPHGFYRDTNTNQQFAALYSLTRTYLSLVRLDKNNPWVLSNQQNDTHTSFF